MSSILDDTMFLDSAADADDSERSDADPILEPNAPQLNVDQIYLRDLGRFELASDSQTKRLATELERSRNDLRRVLFRIASAAEEGAGLLRAVLTDRRSFDRVLKVEGKVAHSVKRNLPKIVERLEARLRRVRERLGGRIVGRSFAKDRERLIDSHDETARDLEVVSRVLAALKIEMSFIYPIADRAGELSEELVRVDETLTRRYRDPQRRGRDQDREVRWRELSVRAGFDPLALRRKISALDEVRERYLDAKSELCVRNLRLVVSLVHRFRNRGMPFLDLVQEGTMGLMAALDKFEIGRGHRLSTYATYWIRQSILRCIANQSRVVRLPLHMTRRLSEMRRLKQEFSTREGRDAHPEDLEHEAEMPLDDLRVLNAFVQPPLSIDKPMGTGDDERSAGDLLADGRAPSVLDEADTGLLRDRIDEVLETLSPQQREIVEHRYGLRGEPAKTLEELGKLYRVSRERIRQIEVKALERLRDTDSKRMLEEFAPTGDPIDLRDLRRG